MNTRKCVPMRTANFAKRVESVKCGGGNQNVDYRFKIDVFESTMNL